MKKLAYIVLAHSDEKHLERLINRINYKCDIYIHIDKKADIEKFNNIINKNNIYISQKRFNIQWGGFNMVNATKHLIEMALTKYNEYTHIILISGMDYPIKNIEYIYEFFNRNKDIEFIRAFDINKSGSVFDLNRVRKYWFWNVNVCNIKLLNRFIRKILFYLALPFNKSNFIQNNITPCFGSQWWALTPQCAKYVIDYSKENKHIDRYFKYAFAPDELYFHTIIFNSKFKDKCINKKLEVNRGYWEWSNIHLIDSSLAKYFTEKDFDEINHSNKLFVRKVNTEKSEKLLDMIDENILKKW